jgi:hypothetical protein
MATDTKSNPNMDNAFFEINVTSTSVLGHEILAIGTVN